MMTSPRVLFYLACLIWSNMAQTTALNLPSAIPEDRGFLSPKTGENLTLQCFLQSDFPARLYWYKHSLGQKPKLISTFHKFDKDGTFHGDFKNNPRFALDTGNGKCHLKISDLGISDSATYSCIRSYLSTLNFSESYIVSVDGTGLNILTLAHQSASESIQPEGSMTLNCTVHTGTYYCAVASCGLSGHGTDPDYDGKVDSVLVYVLGGALVIATILVVLLARSVYKMKKRISCLTAESQARLSAPSTTNTEGYQDAHNLHYAALPFNQPNRSRRQKNDTENDCVYSSVRK